MYSKPQTTDQVNAETFRLLNEARQQQIQLRNKVIPQQIKSTFSSGKFFNAFDNLLKILSTSDFPDNSASQRIVAKNLEKLLEEVNESYDKKEITQQALADVLHYIKLSLQNSISGFDKYLYDQIGEIVNPFLALIGESGIPLYGNRVMTLQNPSLRNPPNSINFIPPSAQSISTKGRRVNPENLPVYYDIENVGEMSPKGMRKSTEIGPPIEEEEEEFEEPYTRSLDTRRERNENRNLQPLKSNEGNLKLSNILSRLGIRSKGEITNENIEAVLVRGDRDLAGKYLRLSSTQKQPLIQDLRNNYDKTLDKINSSRWKNSRDEFLDSIVNISGIHNRKSKKERPQPEYMESSNAEAAQSGSGKRKQNRHVGFNNLYKLPTSIQMPILSELKPYDPYAAKPSKVRSQKVNPISSQQDYPNTIEIRNRANINPKKLANKLGGKAMLATAFTNNARPNQGTWGGSSLATAFTNTILDQEPVLPFRGPIKDTTKYYKSAKKYPKDKYAYDAYDSTEDENKNALMPYKQPFVFNRVHSTNVATPNIGMQRSGGKKRKGGSKEYGTAHSGKNASVPEETLGEFYNIHDVQTARQLGKYPFNYKQGGKLIENKKTQNERAIREMAPDVYGKRNDVKSFFQTTGAGKAIIDF